MFIGKYIESVRRLSGITWAAIRKTLGGRYKDWGLNQQFIPDAFSSLIKTELCKALNRFSSFPAGVDKRLYCWSQAHFLKRNCPAFQEDLNGNRIHLNEYRKVCPGAYLPRARPVFMRREKSGRESVADAEKLRYPTRSSYLKNW